MNVASENPMVKVWFFRLSVVIILEFRRHLQRFHFCAYTRPTKLPEETFEHSDAGLTCAPKCASQLNKFEKQESTPFFASGNHHRGRLLLMAAEKKMAPQNNREREMAWFK